MKDEFRNSEQVCVTRLLFILHPSSFILPPRPSSFRRGLHPSAVTRLLFILHPSSFRHGLHPSTTAFILLPSSFRRCASSGISLAICPLSVVSRWMGQGRDAARG
jgi:hypothetical protein